jgi:hypothetical protein
LLATYTLRAISFLANTSGGRVVHREGG